MLKLLNTIFVFFGIVFLTILIAGAVFFVVDPYEIKPLLHSLWGSPAQEQEDTSLENSGNQDENTLLSDQQEAMLESIGIDPASLPNEITPEMEECFTRELGEERTAEIKGGSAPTAADYFQARSCLN